jgi:hypothetical protein
MTRVRQPCRRPDGTNTELGRTLEHVEQLGERQPQPRDDDRPENLTDQPFEAIRAEMRTPPSADGVCGARSRWLTASIVSAPPMGHSRISGGGGP